MQCGEGQFHLRLDPDRPGHPQVRRLLDHVIQQGGLPHACFAPHDQHRAAPGTHLLEQPVQDPALDPSPEQPAGRSPVVRNLSSLPLLRTLGLPRL